MIRTVWCWYKARDIDQRSKIDFLEIDPHLCDQLMYDQDANVTQLR